jgi:SpoVK/Ycf46/Vps4 family AAA+-type ATPase
MVDGARAQFSRDSGSLATRKPPRFGFDDLVLPAKEKEHLTELLAFVERRGTVYETWGFEQKFTRGTGAKALFFGRSGTGKTMAAEVLAKHLSLDLFKVDLSSVVSKWVGETEKNLATIFDRAEEAQAVLLFDEADALFGQRTSVGSAVDRYANLETNYLLQRIEEYDGVAVLSSNFKQNIDEAFTRRFHFIIEFPFPDRDSREEIWQRSFPDQAPLDDDVDFDFLADRFKFTGGNIKNTILRAAFLGASEGAGRIRMRHLLRAVVREYQNLEREPTRREFGDWWVDVKDLMEDEKGQRRRSERR